MKKAFMMVLFLIQRKRKKKLNNSQSFFSYFITMHMKAKWKFILEYTSYQMSHPLKIGSEE